MSNTTTTTTVFTKGFYTVERRETADAVEIVEVSVMPASGKRHEHVSKLSKSLKGNYSDEEWKGFEDILIKCVCDGVPSEEAQKKEAAEDERCMPVVLTREQVRKMGKAKCIRGRWCRDYSGTILENF